MFKSLLNFAYKRNKLEALGFCITFFAMGSVIAIAIGALEYFLFSGHKYRHLISGGKFVLIIELWVLSYLLINAKRLYKNPAALLLMGFSTVLCIFSSILSWVFVGILSTFSPLPCDNKKDNRIAVGLFRSIAILIPLGFLVYDCMFIGVIPAIGIDSARTLSYIAKHPEALKRRDEIEAVKNAYVPVRFKNTRETALRGYEFSMVCAKYGRYYDAEHLLSEIHKNDLDPKRKDKAERIHSLVLQYTSRFKYPLDYFSSQISGGYCTDNSRAGGYSAKAGDYAGAAVRYENSFETIGCNRMMDGFDLVDVFKQQGQYKDAIYVIDQIIEDEITNETGIRNMQIKRQEIAVLGEGGPADGHYHERYEKFKVYRAQFKTASKIDAKSNPAKAEEELLKAVNMSVTIVDVVRTRMLLAHVYEVSGQYERALSEIQWLKQNLGRVNDRMISGLDWNEWVIKQRMKGGDTKTDPITEEVQKILQE